MYAPYKQAVLKEWQDKLRAKGIEKKEYLLVYSSQILQESGSLSPLTVGDHGCSWGVGQKNWCSHEGINAKQALKKYPEWANLDHQLEWFATSSKQRLDQHKEIKWAVVAHNAPAMALKRQEPRYWKDVNKRAKELEWIEL